jgi:methyltransferase (TIGR00027 family)
MQGLYEAQVEGERSSDYSECAEVPAMKHMTAMVSCFARAYHFRMNQVRIFSDDAAEILLNEDCERIAQNMIQGIDYFLPEFQGSPEEGLRLIADRQLSPSVLGRSAFCEAMLEKAVKKGCGQYVILASGYDTFGIRNKNTSLKVFEADLPDLLEDKKERMEKAGLNSASVFVPCDLSDPSWKDGLLEKGFDKNQTAFAGMLGISYYLTKDEFGALLSTLGDLLPTDSELCLDCPMEEEGHESRVNRELAQGADEAMKARYFAAELDTILKRNGFEIRTVLKPEEMTEQYFSRYNRANEEHRMEAPAGVCYVLAVCKKGAEKE